MDPCPTSDLLCDLLAGALRENDREAVRAHVENCRSCQESLEAMVAAEENDLAQRDRTEQATLSEESFLRELSESAPPADWSNDARVTKLIRSKPLSRPLASLDVAPGYEILGELGRGGMGIVYKARQIRANRLVALKMILGGDHARPEDLLRFRKEAEAPARLRHPNIVQIYEVGEHAGLPFFSMEFADSGSLAQHLKREPQPPRDAAALLAKLADAVHYAHVQGVIHRDLKPANVLLQTAHASSGKDTVPKIADFGLAQLLNDSGQTRTGTVLGTPSYMAPEQARSARVGPGADIYALGAILFETLTGRPPFLGETGSDTVRQLQEEDPVAPRRLQPGIPRDLETICLKCLEKEPGRRYRTADALALDLRRYLEDRPVLARAPSLSYRWIKFAWRNKALVAGVLGIVAALFLGAIVSLLFALGEAHQRTLADANAQQREDARRLALSEAYQARVLAAQAALNEHDPVQAERHLDAAPEEFRCWEWYHFKSRLDESSQRIGGMPELTWTGAAYDPDGWRAFAVGPIGLSSWDLRTGRRLTIILEGSDSSAIAASTTKGIRCLVTSSTGPPRIVDSSGRTLQTLQGTGRARFASFDADGGLVAIIYEGSTAICIYETTTGKSMRVWKGNALARTCMSFSPDGRAIASGDMGGIVVILDPRTGAKVGGFETHPGAMRSLNFRKDGKRLITAGDDQTVRQWELPSGRPLDVRYLATLANAVVFSPDGKWIAAAGVDRSVRIWPAEGGEVVGAWHGHTQVVTELMYSPDGTELASVGRDGVRLWPVKSGTGPGVLRGHGSFVYPVACSHDGRLIASGGWDSAIRLWDAAGGEPVGTLTGHGAWIADVAFSPNSRRLYSLSNDSSLRVWDVDARRVMTTLGQVSVVSPAQVQKIAIHPSGELLATGSMGEVRFWDLVTGRELEKLNLGERTIRIVAYSPDARWLAAVRDNVDGKGDGVVVLVDQEARRSHVELRGHQGLIHAVSFSPDSNSIVTAGQDRIVRLWNVKTGELIRQMEGHFHEVFAAAFAPDGTRIATGGRDRIIRLWDPKTGEQMAQLRGHTDYVFSLAFTPDGSTLVSGSGDTTVRLWRTVPRNEERRDTINVGGRQK